jgi:hypothetical protein
MIQVVSPTNHRSNMTNAAITADGKLEGEGKASRASCRKPLERYSVGQVKGTVLLGIDESSTIKVGVTDKGMTLLFDA